MLMILLIFITGVGGWSARLEATLRSPSGAIPGQSVGPGRNLVPASRGAPQAENPLFRPVPPPMLLSSFVLPPVPMFSFPDDRELFPAPAQELSSPPCEATLKKERPKRRKPGARAGKSARKADKRAAVPDKSRPFPCQVCGQTFTQAKNRRRHQLRHQSEPRYKCDQCDRGFYRSDDFQNHLARHQGIRKFACHCGRKYFRSSDLTSHQKKAGHGTAGCKSKKPEAAAKLRGRLDNFGRLGTFAAHTAKLSKGIGSEAI